MRSHSEIVAAAGVTKLAELLPVASVHTITSWRQRSSIPSEHWSAIADAGLATLAELAAAAAARRTPSPSPAQEAEAA